MAATLPFEMFFSREIETSGPGLGRAEAGARGLNLRTPLEKSLKGSAVSVHKSHRRRWGAKPPPSPMAFGEGNDRFDF